MNFPSGYKKRELTSIAINVLTNRYLQKDEFGKPKETIDELWKRVARHAASAEKDQTNWYDIFYTLLSHQLFLFNSPTLVNAGTSINGLSACFVVGMEDSIDSIWNTKKNFAKIAQKGGGCGVNICDLRPKGDFVSGSTHARAGGPVAFLETIWKDMNAITQSGFRNMACMSVMRVDHPDIFEFITAKNPINALSRQLGCSLEESQSIWNDINNSKELTKEQQRLIALSENYLNNFNISVGITDNFMRALESDSTIDLHFNGKIYETASAKQIWNLIVESAHRSGDPGLLFLDTVNNNSPYRYSGQTIKSTNPCGEQPLPANGCCNLGSIDLSKFVIDGKFDWDFFKEVVAYSTRALNDIIEVASWPTEDIQTWIKNNAPIGLGIMGYADALLSLNLRYGSKEALKFASDVAEFMYYITQEVSEKLADERGIPDSCVYLPKPRRNMTLLTIAPTGTLSLIAGCSSGCEPVFQYTQVRTDNTGSYIIVHPELKKQFGVKDVVYNAGTSVAELKDEAFSIVNQIKQLGGIFVDANELTIQEHIDTQAAFQKHIDSGVSKTINLHNKATIADVDHAFRYAYKSGCKGITIYRDGSKFVQILNKVENKKQEQNFDVLSAKRYKVTYKGVRWYIIVSETDGDPKEVFTITSAEDDTLPTTDALSRVISLALRNGVTVDKIVDQLRKVRQYSISCFPAVLARVLSNYLNTDEEVLKCSECGSKNIERSGGCPFCKDCGNSKCK